MKPQQIIKIGGDDWMSGLSTHINHAIGGIFRSGLNFDPFKNPGYYQGSNNATRVSDSTITATIKWLVGVVKSGSTDSFAYGFGDGSKLYEIDITAETTTDYSAQISGITTCRGAVKFRGRILYANDSTVKSNTIVPVLANEVSILTGLTTGEHVMHVGPDRNCYVTNVSAIGRIVDEATAAATNIATAFAFESDVITRSISDDGQYLVIIGDTASNDTSAGHVRCLVAFWNMKSAELSKRYEIQDSHLWSIANLDGTMIIFGDKNIYTCTATTDPKPLFPMSSIATFNIRPIAQSRVASRFGFVFFADGGSEKIYGFGRIKEGQKPIFFQPNSAASGVMIQAITTDGNKILSSTTNSRAYKHDSAATVDTSSLVPVRISLNQKFIFTHAIVRLRTTFSSGQAVSLSINSQGNGKVTLNSSTKNFTNNSGQHELWFYPNHAGSSSDAPYFSEIDVLTLVNDGAVISELEVWGVPVAPNVVV